MNNEKNENKYLGRHFYSSPSRDLFYVEVYDVGLHTFFFESSLHLNFSDYPQLVKLIRIIVQKKLPGKTRRIFVGRLFYEISKVKNVEKFYFKEFELDKHGKYSESLAKVYLSVLYNQLLQVLVPYSPYTNSVLFEEVKSAYEPNDGDFKKELSKEKFETTLINDELRNAYVDVYVVDAVYYFQSVETTWKTCEFYFMTSKESELLLLFFIKVIDKYELPRMDDS